MTPETNHLEFDAVTTLDDYVALRNHTLRRPRQLMRLASLGLASFVWYTLTLMVQHLFNFVGSLSALADPEVLQGYMNTDGWSDLIATMTMVGAWVGGIFLLLVLVVHPLRARAFARRILRERPDIDVKDRKLTQHNHCRLDDDGYTWSVPDTRSSFAWPHFTHLVETRRHLFMMMSPSAGVVFPKHAMDRELIDDVRTFVGRHLDARGADAERGRPA